MKNYDSHVILSSIVEQKLASPKAQRMVMSNCQVNQALLCHHQQMPWMKLSVYFQSHWGALSRPLCPLLRSVWSHHPGISIQSSLTQPLAALSSIPPYSIANEVAAAQGS
jgi:hypothetical protein